METIESGTTAGRLVRTALLTVMLGGYAGWSLFDGFVAYPRANVEAVLRTKLGMDAPDAAIMPSPHITARSIEGMERGTNVQQLDAALGQAAVEHDGLAYYFGQGGYVTVEWLGGSVETVAWTDGPMHSPASIGFQKLIGFALLPVVLVMLVQLVRVVRTRAVLSAEGLTIGRRSAIPLASIVGVVCAAPGRYDVTFTRGDKTTTIRLDDYVIAKAPEIVRAICAHRGLPDPTGSA